MNANGNRGNTDRTDLTDCSDQREDPPPVRVRSVSIRSIRVPPCLTFGPIRVYLRSFAAESGSELRVSVVSASDEGELGEDGGVVGAGAVGDLHGSGLPLAAVVDVVDAEDWKAGGEGESPA